MDIGGSLDYQRIYNDLNDYLIKHDKDTYLKRYDELIKSFPKKSQEYVEMLLIKLSYSIIYEANYQAIETFINEVEPQVNSYGSDIQKIKFSINKGVVYGRLEQLDKALAVYNQVLALCNDSKFNSYKVSTLINIGVVYNKRYQYIKSLRFFLRAYSINVNSESPVKHTSILANLGVIYLNIEEYEKAVYYFELCMKTLADSRKYTLPALYNNLILAYSKIGNFSKAQAIITKAEQSIDTYNQVNLLAYKRSLAEYYFDSGDLASSAECYLYLISNSEPKLSNAIAEYKIALAKTYLLQDKLDQCKNLLDEITTMGDFSEIIKEQIDFLRIKAEFYEKLGDYQKAYEFSQEIIKLNDDNYLNLQAEIMDGLTEPIVSDVEDISSVAYREKINDLEAMNTELISKEKLLVESLNELKKESNLREKIISIITHDIRSPIGNIIQLFEMLDELDDLEEEETLKEIIQAMKQTYALTDELVHWAKDIISQKQARLVNLEIEKVIDNCQQVLKHQLQKKHISLNKEIATKDLIYGHQATIETCFRNIISNAIKYSNEFSDIDIIAETKDEKISFIIKDYGKGMSQEEVAKIFDYNKVSTLGTNMEDGIGIGLLLVKELVDKNNGTIECKSQLGQGTVFTLTFPKVINKNTNNK